MTPKTQIFPKTEVNQEEATKEVQVPDPHVKKLSSE